MTNKTWQAWAKTDIVNGGPYKITGTVTELGVAGEYRVRLFDSRHAILVREVFSNKSGAYSIPYIKYLNKGYFVVAHDNGVNPLNAAICDLVTPEIQ